MRESVFRKIDIIIIVLGVLLTALAFCFYFLLNIIWLNILLGLICFSHMIYLMYFQLGNKEEFTKKERIIYPTVLLAIVYGVLIALICVFNPLGEFYFDYILWVLYCGSSIIPIFYIILILMAFAS